jgi:uncharacterized iron-regulated protein
MRAASCLLLCLGACATGPVVRDVVSGTPVSVDQIAQALHDRDVVFLGEQHDSDEGHRLQLAIVEALAERQPRLAISMEMFERDVQEALDDYLAGRVDEATFLQRSRPWRNYRQHYRPIVELARARNWPVVAANLPTELARKVGREGPGAVGASPHAARSTSAPRDRYYDAFTQAMGDHQGGDRLWQLYQAQCFKDDTMAESIVAARQRGSPLVVHLCGAFHCNYRLGTVARVLEREPGLRVGIVTMVPVDPDPDDVVKLDGAGPIADFVVAVRGEQRARPAQPATRPQHPATQPATRPATQPATQRARDPHADPHAGVADAPPVTGRPALGLMPDYDFDGEGLRVERVTEGGAAAAAGIEDGDVIVKLAGRDVADVQGYMGVLGGLQPGQKTTVVVQRDGATRTLEVTVGRR